MLRKVHGLAVLLFLSSFSTSSYAAGIEIGKTYFTKHNFMFEKGRHITTNYWRGDLMPINTQVTVVSLGKKKMVLSAKGGEVTISNVAKHTKKSLQEVADRMLSDQPVLVGGPFAKDVKFAEVRLGMNKADVIRTRGYPPAHKTYSTESDRWIYWSSRFVQQTLIFENNRLVEGRGLR